MSETMPPRKGLSHVDEAGEVRMVDTSGKQETARRARARAIVRMSPRTARAIAAGEVPKGDVLATVRIAGIGAAKRTAELIPLCHPLGLDSVEVKVAVDPDAGSAAIEAEARTVGRTGVEMEAMTAAAVAALTLYDMVKGMERGVAVEEVVLVEKEGGRSGHWLREGA
jgi:cyclic pyranopterin monophosphate synthase